MTKAFLIACMLALATTLACDAQGARPTLPSGGKWINYTNLSYDGPLALQRGIVAATSIDQLRAAVVAVEMSRHPASPADQICPMYRCWPNQTEQPGLLYLAVGEQPDECDTDVKEAAAIAGRTLYFIHWVSARDGSRCDAGQGPAHWRLLSVSRRDLPGVGTLTVRLQVQGSFGSSAMESQVQLS